MPVRLPASSSDASDDSGSSSASLSAPLLSARSWKRRLLVPRTGFPSKIAFSWSLSPGPRRSFLGYRTEKRRNSLPWRAGLASPSILPRPPPRIGIPSPGTTRTAPSLRRSPGSPTTLIVLLSSVSTSTSQPVSAEASDTSTFTKRSPFLRVNTRCFFCRSTRTMSARPSWASPGSTILCPSTAPAGIVTSRMRSSWPGDLRFKGNVRPP
mmetsp:Transcript_795/g.3288  ORF Transcript_795/g.3288 Transcript_795/m.3288 type:complete len:210 (-) Transcript_795:551-1180(-)